MTDPPRFLIAKYVPDVFRNEPRNIGVVLWSPDGIVARFAGEKSDAPGEVDDAQIPTFVASPEAYKQWIRYWRREIGKEAIRPAAGGPSTPRGSPGWLSVLCQVGSSNFLLADGGTLTEPIPDRELSRAVEYLFENYVASAELVRSHSPEPATPVPSATATVKGGLDAERAVGVRDAVHQHARFSTHRAERVVAEKTVCVLLVRGEAPTGERIYAYLAIRADRLAEFMEAQKDSPFYPEEYGVIVASGTGEPNEEMRARMTHEYGFNHDAMLDIAAAVSKTP